MAKNRKKNDGVSHPTANSDNCGSVEAPIVAMENVERISHKTVKNKRKRSEESVVDINGSEIENETKTNGDDGEMDVTVHGKGVKFSGYKPLKTISDPRMPDEALDCCYDFSIPSTIQAYSWPFILAGRNFIGIAPTGPGKTLAFGIPGIVQILRKRREPTRRDKPLFLVLSCTRESAIKIADELRYAGSHRGIRAVCVYEEDSKRPQISSLLEGVDIVIGTPRRLNELVVSNFCQLDEVSYVVLDEVDRLLDSGFEPEVRNTLKRTCTARQTVMFSATWPLPKKVEEFMGSRPVKVAFGVKDLSAHRNVEPQSASTNSTSEVSSSASTNSTSEVSSSGEEESSSLDDKKDSHTTPDKDAKAYPDPSKTLHMKNLDYHIQEADVENFFKGCGEVVNVDFALRVDGTRNGAGHVQFATAEAAKKALKEKNCQILNGRKVFLNFATPAGRDANSNKESGGSQPVLTICVDYNSEPDSMRNALRELFSTCGDVTSVGVPRDENGCLKGTALIEFSSSEEVDRALKLDGHKFRGYCIRVRANKPKVPSRFPSFAGNVGG